LNSTPLIRQPAFPLWPLTAAVLAALAPSVGHTSDATAPGAGNLLQQVAPPPTAAPVRSTVLRIERADGSPLAVTSAFEVRSLLISGNTRYDTGSLHALVADAEGQRLTLAQLDAVIARITAHYRRGGYPLARAIIPAQTIQSGVVRIEVIEARLGEVQIDNRSRVDSALLRSTAAPLRVGEVIAQAPLDRALLLMSDIPGVNLSALLRPGAATGTSDLAVTADPLPALMGQVSVDNQGNRFTGRARVGAAVSLANPLQRGDMLNVQVLSSGAGLNHAQLSYQSTLSGQGTRAGTTYAALRYRLGDSAEKLQAHGTAGVSSLWLSQPLLRSADLNLRGQFQYDHLQLRDHVDASAIRSDRHLGNWALSLSGDARDAMLPGGDSLWNIVITSGRLAHDDAAAAAADAGTSKVRGGFSKINLFLSHVQPISPAMAVALRLTAQSAQANLDPSQKLSLGGPQAVRAYDSGAISGDSGWAVSLEYRLLLDALAPQTGGRWQATLFIDSGRLTINQQPWQAGINAARLSGAGLGLRWSADEQWSAQVSMATPIGKPAEALGIARSTRAWLEIARRF